MQSRKTRRSMRPIWNWTLGVLLTFALMVLADEEHKAASPPGKSVEQITALARQSVVVIKHAGRDGKQAGLGTGFVVDADGLIATNLHVLGEARPITVESADGKP